MKTKFFHLVGEAKDLYGNRHIVTVVGKYKQEYIQKEYEGEILDLKTEINKLQEIRGRGGSGIHAGLKIP